MPIHDWTRVDAGIFHHFHQQWIVAITNVLNQRLLPREYYALEEQHGASFTPDVLTPKTSKSPKPDDDGAQPLATSSLVDGEGDETAGGGVLVAEPRVRVTAETDLEFYRRKQNVVAVRHVSGDHLVAVVVIVSKGNKSGRKAFDDFIPPTSCSHWPRTSPRGECGRLSSRSVSVTCCATCRSFLNLAGTSKCHLRRHTGLPSTPCRDVGGRSSNRVDQ